MSSMRRWLNNEFFSSAFSNEEQSAISTTKVNNGPKQGNPEWNHNDGIQTFDPIFLLSYTEVEQYLPMQEDRICLSTPYAAACLNQLEGPVFWWLRSCGSDPYTGVCVDSSGVNGSLEVLDISGGVRPAMWVDQLYLQLDKVIFSAVDKF